MERYLEDDYAIGLCFAERDCALELYFEERALREYEAHLQQHPHPADPDHPRKCDYGLEDDDE